MRSLRSLFGEPLDRANRQPVAAVTVVGVVASRIEVEGLRVVADVRARDGRPVVAIRIGIVEQKSIAEAGTRDKDTGRSVIALTANDVSVYIVYRRPNPIAPDLEVALLLFRRHAPSTAPLHMRRVMIRRKDIVRSDPSFAFQSVDILAIGRRVRRAE